MIHELKTWPPYFQAILDFTKTFEVRRDDRGFMVGDHLLLAEWDPKIQSYTGRKLETTIMYIMRNEELRRELSDHLELLQGDVVVMSIGPIFTIETPQEDPDAKPSA